MKLTPIMISIVTAVFAPMWVQHLVAADGGILAIGGGKLTEKDIFGDKRTPGMHPMIFHALAIAGIAHFTLSAMAIIATTMGGSSVRKMIGAVYMMWLVCIAVVQYTHPWTGTAPTSLMEMPMPLVYFSAALVGAGVVLDK